MMTYQKFKKLNIDHSMIGIDQRDSYTNYFCTPKGAKVIGNAGIDGIHYCFIEEFEEMVFAVSSEGIPGEYVHPIAKSFEDLLRLLLACGSMDAIEQPFAYIKELQRSFDYSKLKFSEEYYELMPKVEVSEVVVPEWKVTYEGGFYSKRGRAGKEVRLDKEFSWGNEIWHIPSVYLCTKGLVVDFCVEVEPELVKDFINKWHLHAGNDRNRSNQEYEQIQEENPLNIDFRSEICANGSKMLQKQGYGVSWIPQECMQDEMEIENKAKWVLEHYGCDLKKAWAVHRISYPWAEKRPRKLKSLEIKLEREMAKIPSKPFTAPVVGASHIIVNPVTGVEHILTVHDYEEGKMDASRFRDDSMEWPTNYAIMTYTLFPEFEDFYLQDSCQGDSPRRKELSSHGLLASSVGIIGLTPNAEDESEYYHPDGTVAKLRVCCSSMYFERPEKIEWKMTFREKRVPDIEIVLISEKKIEI